MTVARGHSVLTCRAPLPLDPVLTRARGVDLAPLELVGEDEPLVGSVEVLHENLGDGPLTENVGHTNLGVLRTFKEAVDCPRERALVVQPSPSGIPKLGPLLEFLLCLRLPVLWRAPNYWLVEVPGLVGIIVKVPIDRPNPPVVKERGLIQLVVRPCNARLFCFFDLDPFFFVNWGPWFCPLAPLGIIGTWLSPAALLGLLRVLEGVLFSGLLGKPLTKPGTFLSSDW